MTALRDRLASLRGERGAAVLAPAEHGLDLRQALARGGRLTGQRPAFRAAADLPLRGSRDPDVTPFPGELVEGPRGPWRRLAVRHALDRPGAGPARGAGRVLDALGSEALRHLAALAADPRLGEVAPERWLFVDTETTGLSGGAGTLAWVVGLAWLERSDSGWHAVVEQHVLDEVRREPAMLEAVGARMAAAGAVVTFNGKSFDMPLLETRFVLSRLRVPAGLPHADLLHPARRLLEPRLPDVRLGSLERAILGFEREDDIEGADIPQAWFDWLHAGETADVIRAVRHNAWDLLALIGLLESLVLLATGEAASSVRADGMGLVDHRLRLGDEAGARARIASIGSEPLEGARARRRARLTRRLLGPEAARGHWQELVRRGDPFAEPHEELAKLLEHRDRDPAAALRIVEAALRHAPPRGARERLLRRLARLEALVAGPRGRLAAKGPEFTELACTDTLRAPAAWKSSRSATRTAPSRRSPSS